MNRPGRTNLIGPHRGCEWHVLMLLSWMALCFPAGCVSMSEADLNGNGREPAPGAGNSAPVSVVLQNEWGVSSASLLPSDPSDKDSEGASQKKSEYSSVSPLPSERDSDGDVLQKESEHSSPSPLSSDPSDRDLDSVPSQEESREPSISDDKFMDYWREKAETHRAFAAEKIERNVELVPELTAPPPDTRKLTRPQKTVPLPVQKITLVMRNAEVREIFQALARTADQNVLVSKGVEGVMSVELRDVAWDEAFTGLLQNLGLHYLWTGKIIRVLTVEEFRSSLELEKLEKERQEITQDMKRTEPLILQTVDIHYADAEKLAVICEDLLTTASNTSLVRDERNQYATLRGSVSVDKENNALIIHAIRDDILKMLDVIEALDRPKNQVLIEARIIVASRETARELGMQWGGVGKIGSGWVYPGSNTTGVLGSTAGTALAPVAGNMSNFPASSVSSSSGSTGGTDGTATGATDTGTTGSTVSSITGLALGYALQSGDNYLLNIQLSALESVGKAHILASPSVTTLDNQEAVLKSGSEIPYQSYSESEGTEVEFKEALLELRVRPHVIDQHMVRLDISASNDEPDYSRVDSGTMSEPAISRRSAQTNVLLYDGETTVIGGLSTSYGNNTKSGVPWLKDIPWIGVLFRSDANEERQEDMLIFITPHILNDRWSGPGSGKLNGPTDQHIQRSADTVSPKPAHETDATQTREKQ